MRRRKILIVVLGLVVLSQLPFAYRRYRLGRLQKAIQELESQRVPPTESEYVDYQGVIHVHSSLGGHSTGTFAELIAAAKANQLDFVIMTEHPQAEFNTSAMTLNSVWRGVLFVNGNEVVTLDGDRILLIAGSDTAGTPGTQTTEAVVEIQKGTRHPSIIAYPTESGNWQSSAADGVEIYNLFTNAREGNKLVLFFDSLWSYRSYSALMFANFFSRPDGNLSRWDQAITASKRRWIATAGNDAHSNIGLSVNDASGRQWIGIKLDPYERSFRVVRTHVFVKRDSKLTRESLLDAISQGHCYVSFDLFGDPKGFGFSTASGESKIMGDEVTFAEGLNLIATAPLVSRFVLFKDGSLSDQKLGTKAVFPISAKGVYRVEVYLDSLPPPATGKPWILSNPIYVRQAQPR
jgi:hypothetical protein